MAKVISIVNLKGGVGKTAIAVNFSAYCGSRGYRTLLVDLDPQTNATFSCIEVEEWENHAQDKGTVANLLGLRSHSFAESSDPDVSDIIKRNVFPGVDLIPSHLDLFTVDLDLAGATGRELRLRRALQPVLDDYDIIVCDCPPNLTIPTQNGLAVSRSHLINTRLVSKAYFHKVRIAPETQKCAVWVTTRAVLSKLFPIYEMASTHYVVPISPDYLSGIGVGILLTRVRGFCADLLGHQLTLAGMIISRVGRTAEHRTQTVNALRTQFGDDVLETEIKERVAVSAAAASNRPVFDQGDADAASEFSSMSREVLVRVEKGAQDANA